MSAPQSPACRPSIQKSKNHCIKFPSGDDSLIKHEHQWTSDQKKHLNQTPTRNHPNPNLSQPSDFFLRILVGSRSSPCAPGEAPDAPTVPEGWAGERQRRWQGFRSGACRVCQPRKCRTARLYVRTQLCHYVWMICIYMCVYVFMYACMYVCMYVSLCVCKSVCLYVCMFICVYICMSVCLNVCLDVYM